MLRFGGGKRFLRIGSGVPSWVLFGSSADLDFADGLYYAGPGNSDVTQLTSTSRASSGLAQTASGSWTSFGPNTARITNQGLLVEEARTNLFLNSAAAATQNVTLGVGTYVVTVWGGSGSVTTALGTAVATGFGLITASVMGTKQVLTVTVGGTISCTVVGSPLYVQVELGAFGTSPIITLGVTATRAADVITLTGAAATAALAAKSAYFETNDLHTAAAAPRLVVFAGGALFNTPSATTVAAFNGTNAATATIGGAGTIAGIVKSAFGMDAVSMTARANAGTLVTSVNAWVNNTGAATLGNNAGGTAALNGYMRRATFGPNKGMFDGLTA